MPVDTKWILVIAAVFVGSVASAASPHAPPCELRAFKEGGRFGYEDAEGLVVIEPRFYRAHPCFSEGLAGVKIGDLWFFIDERGEIAIEGGFWEAEPFRDGHARVRSHKGWQRIDRRGETPRLLTPGGAQKLLRGENGAGLLFPAIWLGCCALVAIGAMLIRRRVLRRVHLVRKTKTSRIADARTGPIEIKGRAKAITPLRSPYGGVRCVYWSVTLEEWKRDHENRPQTKLVAHRREAPPFLVEDRSGVAQVEPVAAELRLPRPRVVKASGDKRFVEVCRLLQVDPSSKVLGRRRDLQLTEQTIPEGVRLYVLGFARRRKATGEGGPEAAPIEVFRDEQRDCFILSTFSEQEMLTAGTASAVIARVTFHLANAIGLFFLLRLLARVLS